MLKWTSSLIIKKKSQLRTQEFRPESFFCQVSLTQSSCQKPTLNSTQNWCNQVLEQYIPCGFLGKHAPPSLLCAVGVTFLSHPTKSIVQYPYSFVDFAKIFELREKSPDKRNVTFLQSGFQCSSGQRPSLCLVERT